MRTAVDMLVDVLSSIEVMSYDTLTVVNNPALKGFGGDGVRLYVSRGPPGVRVIDETSFQLGLGEEEEGLWVDIAGREDFRDLLEYACSIIIRDVKKANMLIGGTPKQVAAAHHILARLREISPGAVPRVVVDVGEGDGINAATFMASAIGNDLTRMVAITNLGRISKSMHVLSELERERELSWCLSSLSRASEELLRDGVEAGILTTVCFTTVSPEIFDSFSGFIRFARFASWGLEYRSRGAYGFFEGPKHLTTREQLDLAAGVEGWHVNKVRVSRSSEAARIALLEIGAGVAKKFLENAAKSLEGLRKSSVAGYMRLYKLARYLNALIRDFEVR